MNHSSMTGGGLFRLRRSKMLIPQPEQYNGTNQLFWYYPDDEEPVLYYCNQQNQLFKLDFIPCHT